MKKFTFIIAALIISSAMFAQLTRHSVLSAVKQVDEVHYVNSHESSSKLNTDTLFNFDQTASLTAYGFGPTVWGYWTGHNQYGWAQFAEKFTAPAAGELNELVYMPFAVYDAGSGSVTFKVWNDNSGVPGTELASKTVNLADITAQDLNTVTFDSPVAIDGIFYCGYVITYNTPVDTFSMAQTQVSATNTFMFNDGTSWTDMPTLTGGAITGSNLVIGACVNITFTEPFAEVNPTSWAAGGVEVGTGLTSGTFTLTNSGSGTLTVSNVTGLAAPFTSSFVAGDVSLATDATYQFTFSFNPTVAGAASNTVVIETNGGNITIDLTGTGNEPITGSMDGGFENNVNDFDLVFEGWVQHDVDGALATYGVDGVTFPNSNYEGSFIAFNPTTTNPALGTEWGAFEGNRYGACFAAIPAEGGPNNDWLVIPQSEILNDGASFQAQVQSITADYGLERYAIWVSTTNTEIASFTKISAGTYVEAPTAGWSAINYDLSAYAGQQVYVAVQCVSNDAFAFMIDNILIDNPVNVENNIASAISVFPNPANDVVNVANAENANITIVDMIGNVVATVENASANQSINISNLANGTYFVRVNGEVFKFNVVK